MFAGCELMYKLGQYKDNMFRKLGPKSDFAKNIFAN